jgi:hypothetical protein
MILKVINRLNNKYTLFSVCSHNWYGTNDIGRRSILHKYCVQHNLIPRDLPLSDLDLEGMRNSNNIVFWEVHRLNATRNSRNSLRIFMRVVVFSKQKKDIS